MPRLTESERQIVRDKMINRTEMVKVICLDHDISPQAAYKILKSQRVRVTKECEVCSDRHYAKGLCYRHYRMMRRNKK